MTALPHFICNTHDRASWLNARRTGLGGSDMAAILGLSKWRTPLDVYLDKIGESPEDDDSESKPWLAWGNKLEPVIRQHYSNITGAIIRDAGLLRDREHEWRIGSVDGVTEAARVLEIKTDRFGKGWGEPGTDEIPLHYIYQVQHYLALTGLEVADVAVLVGGSDFRLYHVEADHDLHELMVEAGSEFWQRVLDRDPPEPTTVDDARKRFPISSESAITATDDLMVAVAELRELRDIEADIKGRKDAAQALVMAALGDSDTLVDVDGEVIATWKTTKPRASFDRKGFAAAHPELAEMFTTTGKGSRPFRIK